MFLSLLVHVCLLEGNPEYYLHSFAYWRSLLEKLFEGGVQGYGEVT